VSGLTTQGCGFDADCDLGPEEPGQPTIIAGAFLRPGTHPFLYEPAAEQGGFLTRGAGLDLLADHHDLDVGDFGVRTWGGTSLREEASQVTVAGRVGTSPSVRPR